VTVGNLIVAGVTIVTLIIGSIYLMRQEPNDDGKEDDI